MDDQYEESVCDICDLKLSSMKTSKSHMRIHHMSNSQTQTDDASYDDKGSQSEETYCIQDEIVQTSEGAFMKYQCFYCEFKIESREHLKDHRKKCCEKPVKLNPLRISSTSDFQHSIFPPIGFPSLGFSSLGFPPLRVGFSSFGSKHGNKSTLAPKYSSCSNQPN